MQDTFVCVCVTVWHGLFDDKGATASCPQLTSTFAFVWLDMQVCPGATISRRLRVRNATALPFPFQWSILQQPGAAAGTSCADAFEVSPAAGVLQAQAELEFELEFKPVRVGPHSTGLLLAVQRSGDAGLLSVSQWGQEGTAIVDLTSTAATATGAFGAYAAATTHSTFGVCCDSPQPAALGGCHADACQAAADGDLQTADSAWQPVVQLAAEGMGCPITLTVQPAVLKLQGSLTVGDKACLPVLLCNDTAAPAQYAISPAVQVGGAAAAAAAVVSAVPSHGTVAAHSTQAVDMHVEALAAGTCTQPFAVEVVHGCAQHLQVQVQVQQVSVVPHHPKLDFGILCVGASATRMLQLTNTARNSSAWWCIQQHESKVCCWGGKSSLLRIECAAAIDAHVSQGIWAQTLHRC